MTQQHNNPFALMNALNTVIDTPRNQWTPAHVARLADAAVGAMQVAGHLLEQSADPERYILPCVHCEGQAQGKLMRVNGVEYDVTCPECEASSGAWERRGDAIADWNRAQLGAKKPQKIGMEGA